MTREEKIDMFAMKLDGFTYDAISQKYNVTKQCVQQILSSTVNPNKKSGSKSVYKNLNYWMARNGVNAKKFATTILGFKEVSAGTMGARYLSGQSEFRVSHLQKIKEATGLTYEEILYKGELANERD